MSLQTIEYQALEVQNSAHKISGECNFYLTNKYPIHTESKQRMLNYVANAEQLLRSMKIEIESLEDV